MYLRYACLSCWTGGDGIERDTSPKNITLNDEDDIELRPDIILGGHGFIIEHGCKTGLMLYNVNDIRQMIYFAISDIEMLIKGELCSHSRHFSTVDELIAEIRQGGGGTIIKVT